VRLQVYNAKQAKHVLTAMKSVSEEDKADLEDAQVDAAMFDDAKSCDMALMPVEIDGRMMAAVAGCTYPWGEQLKERSFTFTHLLGGNVANAWVAPIDDVDFDKLQMVFEETASLPPSMMVSRRTAKRKRVMRSELHMTRV
jgi:hypothetical protein